MKKEYLAPAAEKLEFNYTETVVASNVQASEKHDVDDQYHLCPCTTYYAEGWGDNC